LWAPFFFRSVFLSRRARTEGADSRVLEARLNNLLMARDSLMPLEQRANEWSNEALPFERKRLILEGVLYREFQAQTQVRQDRARMHAATTVQGHTISPRSSSGLAGSASGRPREQ